MYLFERDGKMRVFEILFIVATLLVLGGVCFKFDWLKKYKMPILVVEVVLFALSLIVDGYRWQIIPVYLIAFVTSSILLLRNKEQAQNKSTAGLIVKSIVCLLGVGIVIAPLYAIPIITFKAPTGKYEVGTKSVMLSKEKNKKNEKDLMIQLYYPSVDNKGKFTDYSFNIDALRHELARTQGMPDKITGHMNQMQTHSYLDGKVASDEKFPLLIFSHGMTLYNRQNTFQLEELASHGYVIAAINYTKDSALTMFEDQDYVPYEDRDLTLEYLDEHNLEWQADARFVLDSLLNEKN